MAIPHCRGQRAAGPRDAPGVRVSGKLQSRPGNLARLTRNNRMRRSPGACSGRDSAATHPRVCPPSLARLRRAAAMLLGIAVLTVWVPRQVGHIIDDLVARPAAGDALLGGDRRSCSRWAWPSTSCAWAGACSCSPRPTGWAWSCARSCTSACRCRARASSRRQRTGDLMALATNDVDAVEMAAGEAMLAGFDGTLTLVLVVGDDDARRGLAARRSSRCCRSR